MDLFVERLDGYGSGEDGSICWRGLDRNKRGKDIFVEMLDGNLRGNDIFVEGLDDTLGMKRVVEGYIDRFELSWDEASWMDV